MATHIVDRIGNGEAKQGKPKRCKGRAWSGEEVPWKGGAMIVIAMEKHGLAVHSKVLVATYNK